MKAFIILSLITLSVGSAEAAQYGVVTEGSAERIERAKVSCNGSGCTVDSQSGAWLENAGQVTRNGTGDYTVNFESSPATWSSAPTCVVISDQAQNQIQTFPTTSSVRFWTENSSGTTQEGVFMILCMGPR